MKSFLKSSVKACAILCNIPSIFPKSALIAEKQSLILSSEPASHGYNFVPGNSSNNFANFSEPSSGLYVQINCAPLSCADFAAPHAILH